MDYLLLDTNTLLLYLIGNSHRDRLGQKRLENFGEADLDRVNSYAKRIRRHVSLPNVLSETSNLLRQHKGVDAASLLGSYCLNLEEIYVQSENAVKQASYGVLGLTDAAILLLGNEKRSAGHSLTVVTIDSDLYGKLVSSKVKAVNLRHFTKLK